MRQSLVVCSRWRADGNTGSVLRGPAGMSVSSGLARWHSGHRGAGTSRRRWRCEPYEESWKWLSSRGETWSSPSGSIPVAPPGGTSSKSHAGYAIRGTHWVCELSLTLLLIRPLQAKLLSPSLKVCLHVRSFDPPSHPMPFERQFVSVGSARNAGYEQPRNVDGSPVRVCLPTSRRSSAKAEGAQRPAPSSDCNAELGSRRVTLRGEAIKQIPRRD